MKSAVRRVLVFLLTWEARLVLWRHAPKVIAITGSVGKTTGKDAIYAVVSAHRAAAKSQKSFNSDVGVPLAILGLDNPWSDPVLWTITLAKGIAVAFARSYPEWLVLEVGADRPGDIRAIAHWLLPQHVVFTGVPAIPPHIEYFASAEHVFREKRSLIEYLRPGGKVFVNADDMRAEELKASFRSAFVSYGFSDDADFRAGSEEIEFDDKRPTGMRFRLEREGLSVPVVLHDALGRPRIYAALAALAVADALGIDAVSASHALAQWEPAPGRMRLIPGINGSLIIDDTYNASPSAALAALDTLATIKNRSRKIAILGDMLELGKESKEAHVTVGERAAKTVSMLITVGFRARAIGEAALDNGLRDEKIREYEQGEAVRAAIELRPEIKKNDLILIKGSQGMRMEFAVRELMAHPEDGKKLLVRQDEAWQTR